MDSLAVLHARELARWGIETTIIVSGAFTLGSNHFAHSGRPADAARAAAQDGADVGFTVLDRLRAEMPRRVGLGDLLTPVKRG